jgi:hypothetical protein
MGKQVLQAIRISGPKLQRRSTNQNLFLRTRESHWYLAPCEKPAVDWIRLGQTESPLKADPLARVHQRNQLDSRKSGIDCANVQAFGFSLLEHSGKEIVSGELIDSGVCPIAETLSDRCRFLPIFADVLPPPSGKTDNIGKDGVMYSSPSPTPLDPLIRAADVATRKG